MEYLWSTYGTTREQYASTWLASPLEPAPGRLTTKATERPLTLQQRFGVAAGGVGLAA
jgi:hypothetical protein